MCFLQIGGFFVSLYPVTLHSLPLSVFASLLAPFGGFFASGFKRAFKVKVRMWSLGVVSVCCDDTNCAGLC